MSSQDPEIPEPPAETPPAPPQEEPGQPPWEQPPTTPPEDPPEQEPFIPPTPPDEGARPVRAWRLTRPNDGHEPSSAMQTRRMLSATGGCLQRRRLDFFERPDLDLADALPRDAID